MSLLRGLAAAAAFAAAVLGVRSEAQHKQHPASIAFGTAEISLGMTVEQVERALAESARRIEFMSDKHTALVRANNAPVPEGHARRVKVVGQVNRNPLLRHDFSYKKSSGQQNSPAH